MREVHGIQTISPRKNPLETDAGISDLTDLLCGTVNDSNELKEENGKALNDNDKMAVQKLMNELNAGVDSGEKDGWIDEADLDEHFRNKR